MASAAGPKIQLPGALSNWFLDSQGQPCSITLDAMQFFHIAQQIAFASSRSGPTAARPTVAIQGLYVGEPYYDTDLGLPVFLHSLTGTTIVWHNGAGAPV